MSIKQINLENLSIDFDLLRTQKCTLVAMAMSEDAFMDQSRRQALDGIINLIDEIQDKAVAYMSATEKEVFFPDKAEEYIGYQVVDAKTGKIYPDGFKDNEVLPTNCAECLIKCLPDPENWVMKGIKEGEIRNAIMVEYI